MCGIAGIVSLDPAVAVDPARVARMRDVLRHRGPDGEGLWADGPVALGHRRLAIVDVEGGAQPMADTAGDAVLVFNGEIYNHPALRAELEARGQRYRTRSDTETILQLYAAEGQRGLERLDGMFAFALWDRRRRRLLLARDRLGIKPLYWTRRGDELLFASEIKALLAGGVTAAFERSVLSEFLATRFVSGEETFFAGVRKLLPGRTLTWSAGDGIAVRRYWRPPAGPNGAHASRAEHAAGVRGRLEAAVESHLMSDVPLGVFLSGGLDSSALAALTARATSEPVRTFAVGLDEPDANELAHARLVADAIGARHREVTVTREEFFDALPGLVWHEDEPPAFASGVLLHFVSRLAAAAGVKVVLTGEGADELFLGYDWYRVTALNERLGRPYRRLAPPRARGAARAAVGRLPRPARRYAERSFLVLEDGPRSTVCENFSVFSDARRADLLTEPPSAADPYAPWLRAHAEGSGTSLDRMGRADLETFVVELLHKQDRMSMAASVESRVPFLDHHLVEHAGGVPSGVKLRGARGKAVLRDAVRDVVPAATLRRRKMGFPVPMDRWLRGPAAGLVDDLVLGPRALDRGLLRPAAVRALVADHRAGARHAERLWLLCGLELWHRVFVDGEAPRAMASAGG